jgi:hypothetical protein
MTSSIVFFSGNPLFFFLDSDSPFHCLNNSIKFLLSYMRKFLKKKIIKLEKINFITIKNCVSKYTLKIMELNVRIVIPQLVDNKQVYEEIPQSKLKFLYVVFLLNESFSKMFCKTNNTYE